MCFPIKAYWLCTTWRIRLNLCILLPTRLHNPNGKSIDSAVLHSSRQKAPILYSGRVFASLLQRCRSWSSTKLCTMFGRLLDWYIMYTFLGALAPYRNSARCKIHFASKSCVLLHWLRYCTALGQ